MTPEEERDLNIAVLKVMGYTIFQCRCGQCIGNEAYLIPGTRIPKFLDCDPPRWPTQDNDICFRLMAKHKLNIMNPVLGGRNDEESIVVHGDAIMCREFLSDHDNNRAAALRIAICRAVVGKDGKG